MRARVGGAACVGCRYLGDDVIEGGSRSPTPRCFGVEFARAGLDFLSLSKGGKFEDAKQPKVGEAAYPVHRAERLRVHADDPSPTRAARSRATCRWPPTIRAPCATAGLTTPIVVAGGICELRAGRGDPRSAARPTSSRPRARRSPIPTGSRRCAAAAATTIRRCEFTNYCEALDQQHKQVTCKLWDRQNLDEPDVRLDASGRRRLVAPKWSNP